METVSIYDLIEEHWGFIVKNIQYELKNYTAIAQDGIYNRVIETLEKALQDGRLKSELKSTSMKSYIKKVIHSRCMDYFRKLAAQSKEKTLSRRAYRHKIKIESRMEDDGEIFEACKSARFPIIEIYQCPVLELRLYGLSRKEIAERLGLSENQVRDRLGRIRRELRKNPDLIHALNRVLDKNKHRWQELGKKNWKKNWY